MYTGYLIIDDSGNTYREDTKGFVHAYAISPRFGRLEDVEEYLQGKVEDGASFTTIAQCAPALTVARYIHFCIANEEGEIVKSY